jgi:hypothetical protein
MAKDDKTVQTTLRVDRETLYKARLALNLRGLSVAKFLAQKLEEVVRESGQELQEKQEVKRVRRRARSANP